jgi:hypothetical protein
MNSVEKARQELLKAELEEKIKYRKDELNSLKKEYEGKCFGSHTFERKNKSEFMGAVYYEKFFLKDNNEIYVMSHSIQCSTFDDYYKSNKLNKNYSRQISEIQLSGLNDKNASYNLYSGYSFFRKEISLDKFKKLWNCGDEINQVIHDFFFNVLPDLKQERITMGDSSSEKEIEDCIKTINIDLIDLKDYPEIHSILQYKHLPMFDRQRWLPKLYIVPIIEWLIKKLQEENKIYFDNLKVIYYNNQSIEQLQDFIIKFK